jgi:hypothetical protein
MSLPFGGSDDGETEKTAMLKPPGGMKVLSEALLFSRDRKP